VAPFPPAPAGVAGSGHDAPVEVVEVEAGAVEQVLVGLPVALRCADVAPVALQGERICPAGIDQAGGSASPKSSSQRLVARGQGFEGLQ